HIDVQGKADLIAANLHVALLHDVEETNLNAFGQIGKFVDTEDASVGARHQTISNGQLVGEITALGHFNRIDFTDQVDDGNVGRGELLAVALIARQPGNFGVV